MASILQVEPKAKRALDMLLIDRSNEFRELASAIGYSTKFDNWEEFILRFCLEFEDCFSMWSEKQEDGDHNKIHKCMTIMSQIGHGKSSIEQMTKLQNMAYRIAKDYGVICQRL
ncbi:conserved hypothetical protein [Nitrosotalea sinensis]|jgi:hypothetical protein|uniref:Uncharacterized protein n=1 Tax=Nitrosotalea sinensis TaxID=1499975 RepID=A0A2H1EGP6_9ARCH|nr:hypothetical protein [Candidatus Nitrosotalea sinensis]SHO45638.1 conserved hypothetical protein [Candidatus Nitrosotalea sinensis]